MNEELLIRFLTHCCAPAELAQVDAWVSAEKANAELVCSWMQGEFCFINLPLSEITNALERHFNVHITISDRNLAADRFSCRLEKNITIIQALDFLKETQKLNYTTHGKAILITPY